MEVNGMKTNKKVTEMKPKVKVSLKILPFGNINYKFESLEQKMEEKESEEPKYINPLTTNIERIDILYDENENYSVPKTTAGR